MTEKSTVYDSAAALVNDEEIASFMADALQNGDAALITKALEVVARAKGIQAAKRLAPLGGTTPEIRDIPRRGGTLAIKNPPDSRSAGWCFGAATFLYLFIIPGQRGRLHKTLGNIIM